MINIFKPKLINGHTKKQMQKHNAGKYIEDPNKLPVFTKVVVFEKGSLGHFPDGDGWWINGEICINDDNIKCVNAFDGYMYFDKIEVYLRK